METSPGKEGLTILRRLITYADKVFHLSAEVIPSITDRRPQPRIPTAFVIQSGVALFWARLGSLNALELVAQSRFFQCWLGQSVCSADTLGRVPALVDADGLRKAIHHIYDRLKRNKALPDHQGLTAAVLDGHESHASYLRHCSGCLCYRVRSRAGRPSACSWIRNRNEPARRK